MTARWWSLPSILELEDEIAGLLRSWCPFCTEANIILQQHGVLDLKVVEADHRVDELDFMNTLKAMTELKASLYML